MSNLPERPTTERLTACGEVVITVTQLSLLRGLLNRPGGLALSRADWARAALPYLRAINPGAWAELRLRQGVRRMNEGWVSRQRINHTWACQLTERANAILDRHVPAYDRIVPRAREPSPVA